MKKFFYLAFAVLAAMTFTACGDDDDDNGNGGKKPVTITKAAGADNAFLAVLDEGSLVQGEKSGSKVSKHVKEIGVLDGGEMSVTIEELDANGDVTETEVIVADVEEIDKTDEGTLIKVKDSKIKGEVKLMDKPATSRAGGMQIEMNITIEGVTYSTNGTPAQCALKTVLATNGGVLDYVCQKFQVKKMIIECEGDVKVFKTINSGNLMAIYDAVVAEDKNALTAEDKDAFNKVVKYVSVSRFGQIDIIYDNGTCDGGDWNWAKNQASQMEMWLKDKGMGNKFIPENPTIDLEFSGNTCMMTINADIKGSKNYTAALTLVMDVVK